MSGKIVTFVCIFREDRKKKRKKKKKKTTEDTEVTTEKHPTTGDGAAHPTHTSSLPIYGLRARVGLDAKNFSVPTYIKDPPFDQREFNFDPLDATIRPKRSHGY
ncbi:MAG: hypothetical protein MUF87_14830 [Anaerolineae bacterium]|nr:hypothetical protein [Anaerolineae bacterium]